MEINYKISREDLVNFHVNHVAETKIYKRGLIVHIIFMLSIIFLIFIISKQWYDGLVGLIGWFVLLLFRRKRMLYLIRRKLNKVFLLPKYIDCFEDTKLSISKNGLESSTSLSEKVYKWESINLICLVDNYIFIKTTSNDELLIPINSFISNENKRIFLDCIIKNTNLKLNYTYPIDIKH